MVQKAIICIDDEKMILDSLKAQIKKYFGNHYLLEFAQSAEEAWEVLHELDANTEVMLIVSDWLMPNTKGDEFLIQVHQFYPQTVKVMLTGQADEAAIERARCGANLFHYLPKPWTEQDLIETIQSGLESV